MKSWEPEIFMASIFIVKIKLKRLFKFRCINYEPRFNKKSGSFKKARSMCQTRKMLLPDQAAINKYCKPKLIVKRKYNEQHALKMTQYFVILQLLLSSFHTLEHKK